VILSNRDSTAIQQINLSEHCPQNNRKSKEAKWQKSSSKEAFDVSVVLMHFYIDAQYN
jgi:hypothetical protein